MEVIFTIKDKLIQFETKYKITDIYKTSN